MNQQHFTDIDEQGIDLKKWLRIVRRNWMLFMICILAALTVAGLILTFSTPEYMVQARILVNQDNDPLDKADLFAQAIYNDPYQLENEIGILKSKSVTRRAIHQLEFTTSYFRENRFRANELYGNSPFSILLDTTHLQPIGIDFNVNFLNDTVFVISADNDKNPISFDIEKILKPNRTKNRMLIECGQSIIYF
jgi:tyrosine-protein kinase Etk/Wzc